MAAFLFQNISGSAQIHKGPCRPPPRLFRWLQHHIGLGWCSKKLKDKEHIKRASPARSSRSPAWMPPTVAKRWSSRSGELSDMVLLLGGLHQVCLVLHTVNFCETCKISEFAPSTPASKRSFLQVISLDQVAVLKRCAAPAALNHRPPGCVAVIRHRLASPKLNQPAAAALAQMVTPSSCCTSFASECPGPKPGRMLTQRDSVPAGVSPGYAMFHKFLSANVVAGRQEVSPAESG